MSFASPSCNAGRSMPDTSRHPTLYQSGISGASPFGMAPGASGLVGDVGEVGEVGQVGDVGVCGALRGAWPLGCGSWSASSIVMVGSVVRLVLPVSMAISTARPRSALGGLRWGWTRGEGVGGKRHTHTHPSRRT